MKLIANNAELGKKFPNEVITYLVRAIDLSDAKARVIIENQIVKVGKNAVPFLVKELENAKGVTRAIVTMSLIRLGKSSIAPLKAHFNGKENFDWVVSYIENEIQGSQVPLGKLQRVLVG